MPGVILAFFFFLFFYKDCLICDLPPPPTHFTVCICVRRPHMSSAGTATLPAPTPTAPSAASRPCMSGVLTGFFRPEWPRLSGLGPAPARSYRICMLDVFGSGQGWHSRCRGNRLPLSALPGTSQTHWLPIKTTGASASPA